MHLLTATRHHDGLFAVGLSALLVLFVAGVLAATRPIVDQVAVHIEAGPGTTLADDGSALLLPGNPGRLPGEPGRESTATLRMTLPRPDASAARWVVWFGRDPLDAIWLQSPTWRSPQRGFFAPASDEGMLPSAFVLPLPSDWQGGITLTLHARSDMRLALRPRVMREDVAMQLSHRAIALQSMSYAGLLMLALLALALYSAARDRSFLALFASACAALLLLAAQNGHLYLLPGFSVMSAWRGAGLWVLGLLFAASVLQVLRRYAGLRGEVRWRRLLDRFCFALVGLAALCLLDLHVLDAWLPVPVLVAIACAIVGTLLVLIEAVHKRVPMSSALLLLALLSALAATVRLALAHGMVLDVLWTRFSYQLALVASAAVLTVGLIGRIAEFRDERDRDHLARVDSERRMGRESARAELALALQTLRVDAADTDIEWLAFRLLLESLLPQLPVASAAVVAFGYHGHDLLLVEPIARKQAVADDVAARKLILKRLAQQSTSLQQATIHEGEACIEALVPLAIRAPGWGMLVLQRAGGDGFSTEEIALTAEFARLATTHADEAMAASQLRRSAEVDALTGVLNRRSIDLWLNRGFLDAHRQQRPLSLLFIDIDHFKSVNDRLGHAGGDSCLRHVARTLRGALDANDMLGRYGGEEFVVLLPGRGGADARDIAERLRSAVERCQFQHEGHDERLTVSIGVATRLDRESTPIAAIERADKALYAAKHGGRNCVHVAPAVFA